MLSQTIPIEFSSNINTLFVLACVLLMMELPLMTPIVCCTFLATELHYAVQFNVFDICTVIVRQDNNVIEQI